MEKKRIILIIVVTLLTLAADQVTKQMARSSLRNQRPVDVISGYLALEYHENPGMAFGLGRKWKGGRYILIAIGIGALFLVWRLVRQAEQRQKAADIAFGLVAGGAIGNLVDRVYIGRVVDFIVMHWQRKAQWPAYNIADAALVAGVILLILVLGKDKKKQEAAAKGSSSKGRKRKAR
jgi:signal peptidase II